MDEYRFCFIKDEYFIDFPDKFLMKNKEIINGKAHNRPCFFVFKDPSYDEILWLIPISSKSEKYEFERHKKISKYGHCNTIVIGEFLNNKTAFLIQNMCPITEDYILKEYLDKNKVPIGVDGRLANTVVENAMKVLTLTKKGIKLVFPDVMSIYVSLLAQLEHQKDEQLSITSDRFDELEI